jgi:hypothetical protein
MEQKSPVETGGITDTKLKQRQRIEWQLKCLVDAAGEMSDNDLDWAIKMQEAWKMQGYLSEKQQTIVDNLHRRYT